MAAHLVLPPLRLPPCNFRRLHARVALSCRPCACRHLMPRRQAVEEGSLADLLAIPRRPTWACWEHPFPFRAAPRASDGQVKPALLYAKQSVKVKIKQTLAFWQAC